MSTSNIQPFNPFVRPYALGRALVSCFSAENVRNHLPALDAYPTELRAEIQQRLRGEILQSAHAGKPRFRRIEEMEVLEQVAGVSSQIVGALENLCNFEWVDIARLICGQFVVGPLPYVDSTTRLTQTEVARFCLLGVATDQITIATTPDQQGVMTTSPLLLQPLGAQPFDGQFVVRFAYNVAPRPIRVVVLEGRAIAFDGLERLAVLAELGFEWALCLVAYGYGMDVIPNYPRIVPDVIAGRQSPTVADLLDPEKAVTIPVRQQVIQIRFPALINALS